MPRRRIGGVEEWLRALTSAIDENEWSLSRPGSFTPGNNWVGGWVGHRAISMRRRREINRCSCQESNLGRPAHSPVTILTELSRLLYFTCRCIGVRCFKLNSEREYVRGPIAWKMENLKPLSWSRIVTKFHGRKFITYKNSFLNQLQFFTGRVSSVSKKCQSNAHCLPPPPKHSPKQV
jgi:hypothetical protein